MFGRIFRAVKKGFTDAVNAVASAVETVVKTVGEVLAAVFEAVGNTLGRLLQMLGALLGGIPGLGGALRGLFNWAASIVTSAFSLAASVIKASFEIFGGGIAGSIRISAGTLIFDGSLIGQGASDIAASFAGSFMMVFAKFIAFTQALFFMQLGERSLTKTETTLLRKIFRRSLRLSSIRIVDGFAGAFSLTPSPFTLGNTIYMKSTSPDDYTAVLVHECVHVWQNQHHGQRYIADALWARFDMGGDAYEWRSEFDRGRTSWRNFNLEAQARFIEDVFLRGRQTPPLNQPGEFYTDDPIGTNVYFENADRTAFARDSIAFMRSIPSLVQQR